MFFLYYNEHLKCFQGVIMFNNSIFINNFITLRHSHYLSSADLTFLLNLKSRSSITNIESGRALPSFEVLIDISTIFAISIDWLVGHSSKPYVENFILELEQNLACTPIHSQITFIDTVPKEYLEYDLRNKFYSLPERANIVFLLQYLKALINQKNELLNTNLSLKNIINTNIFNKTKRLKTIDEKYIYILQSIHRILFNDLRKPLNYSDDHANIQTIQLPAPLFDIFKSYKQ